MSLAITSASISRTHLVRSRSQVSPVPGRGAIEVLAAPTRRPLGALLPAGAAAAATCGSSACCGSAGSAGVDGRGTGTGTGAGARPTPAHAAETIRVPVRPASRVERTIERTGLLVRRLHPWFDAGPHGSCRAGPY